MSMPLDLIFVRHGESESNVVHAAEKKDKQHGSHESVYERPDWEQRLSSLGVKQANAAAKWLNDNNWQTSKFDRCYASPFMRARETALHIGGKDTCWLLDDRIKERDWGEYGATPRDVRETLFPFSAKNQKSNKWYARYNGGESLADSVLMRARDFVGTLHRDMPDKKVLVVSHGEFMWTMRYLIERMLPEEWLAIEDEGTQDIRNCAILHYTRVDPKDASKVSSHLGWMRIIYPDNVGDSPFNGEWQPVPEKRRVTGADIEKQLHHSEPLISRDK